MSRRSFLASLVALLVCLGVPINWIEKKPLKRIEVCRCGAWEQVRLRAVSAGDKIRWDGGREWIVKRGPQFSFEHRSWQVFLQERKA